MSFGAVSSRLTQAQEWTGSLNTLQILAAPQGYISGGIYHLSCMYLNNRTDFIYCCIFNTHFWVNKTKEFTVTANGLLAANTPPH